MPQQFQSDHHTRISRAVYDNFVEIAAEAIHPSYRCSFDIIIEITENCQEELKPKWSETVTLLTVKRMLMEDPDPCRQAIATKIFEVCEYEDADIDKKILSFMFSDDAELRTYAMTSMHNRIFKRRKDIPAGRKDPFLHPHLGEYLESLEKSRMDPDLHVQMNAASITRIVEHRRKARQRRRPRTEKSEGGARVTTEQAQAELNDQKRKIFELCKRYRWNDPLVKSLYLTESAAALEEQLSLLIDLALEIDVARSVDLITEEESSAIYETSDSIGLLQKNIAKKAAKDGKGHATSQFRKIMERIKRT